jgi:predicted nuclease of predicted toxin-antitoxin system
VSAPNSRISPVWLLDANLDIRISQVLSEFGIESHTAESRGWKHLLNGQLVSAAVGAGFTCLLTRDQLFAESASRALKRFPQFAVVLVQLKQRRRPEYLAQFRASFLRKPIVPVPGSTIDWPKP